MDLIFRMVADSWHFKAGFVRREEIQHERQIQIHLCLLENTRCRLLDGADLIRRETSFGVIE